MTSIHVAVADWNFSCSFRRAVISQDVQIRELNSNGARDLSHSIHTPEYSCQNMDRTRALAQPVRRIDPTPHANPYLASRCHPRTRPSHPPPN
ncbi:hypothetical protein RR46_10945 [Papilio xuthus]|uniref:Uncharacterized protein n=1 Tax=Papilio xuthus TaxID=66420 RepID=A0A194PYJ8_PAPXU|nr:hypothetical protein RR46_10945 [Papilio xuthus]